MVTPKIRVTFDPPDLLERMSRYAEEMDAEMQRTGEQVLYHLQGSVPDYPPRPPESTYVRTGTLGRSLGAEGAAPDVATVGRRGRTYTMTLGTRVTYAPYVIGIQEQARHMGHWWTTQGIADAAAPGIERLYDAMAGRMADFLEGR